MTEHGARRKEHIGATGTRDRTDKNKDKRTKSDREQKMAQEKEQDK